MLIQKGGFSRFVGTDVTSQQSQLIYIYMSFFVIIFSFNVRVVFCQSMFFNGTPVGCLIIADVALEWFLVCMFIRVNFYFTPKSRPEIALVALKRFLVCVYQHVRLKVALGDGRVRAEVAFEAFLPFVSFLVNFQCVPVRESFSTHLAVHRSLTCVQLLNVQPQICFPTARGWT